MKFLNLLSLIQIVAILTLVSAGELHLLFFPLFLIIFCAGIIVTSKKIILPQSFFIVIYAAFFPTAFFLYHYLGWHPIILAAHFALLIHALSFLQIHTERLDQFRLAFSFVHLLLAGATTPELHVGAGILFSLILIVSYRALEGLKAKGLFTAQGSRSVRRVLISAVVLLVFGLSLSIFPILPRPRGFGISMGSRLAEGRSQTGFSGQVSLEGTESFDESDERIAYRIFPSQKNLKLETVFPHGLLKVRTLDLFDGRTWMAKRGRDFKISEDKREFDEGAPFVELVREASQHNSLGVPQGPVTFAPESRSMGEIVRDPSRDDFEWLDSRGRRLKYRLQRSAPKGDTAPEDQMEAPNILHTTLPKHLQWGPEWQSLMRELDSGVSALSAHEKVSRLLKYFEKQNFKYQAGGFNADLKGIALLEKFLFEKKAGHCELYASSMAVLLKMWKVPVRLVTGYRLRATHEDLWLANENAGHAWVEYWNGSQWQWVDPTPVAPGYLANIGKSWNQQWKVWTLVVSSYWYKNIVDYDPTATQHVGWGHSWFTEILKSRAFSRTQEIKVAKFKMKFSPFFMGLSGLCFFSLLGIWVFRGLRRSSTETLERAALESRGLLTHARFLEREMKSWQVSNIDELRVKTENALGNETTYQEYLKLYEDLRFRRMAGRLQNQAALARLLELRKITQRLPRVRAVPEKNIAA